MAEKVHITPDLLRQLLRYDTETGKLYWLPRPPELLSKGTSFNKQFAGREAFTYRMGRKHLQGRILGQMFLAHRVIWALVYGQWPSGEIDHINGNPVDNRISNLRDIPKPSNQRNMRRRSDNSSGVSGVAWQESRQKWRVRVASKTVGRFADFGDAVKARQAELDVQGYHPNHGRGPVD